MRLRFSLLSCLIPGLLFTTGCAPDAEPDLRLIAYGTEPGWTIYVWSDSLSLGMAGDHSAHVFPSPPETLGDNTLETAAGELSLQVTTTDEPCAGPGQQGAGVTLSFGDRTYSGCGREPGMAVVRTRDPDGAFSVAAPKEWGRVAETRGDTAAVTWTAGPTEGAEFTVLAMPISGGFEQDGLIALAESFARARYPDLEPDEGLTLAPSQGAIRVTFTGSAGSEDERGRLVVDVAQEPGRLRVLSLFTNGQGGAREEESLLLGGFRWLRPPEAPVAPAQTQAES